MRRIIFFIFIFLSVPSFCVTLNLSSLGSFALAPSEIGYNGYNAAGLTDGNISTHGLWNGYSNYPTAENGYIFKYTFNTPTYITSYRYYISASESGLTTSKVFLSGGSIITNQFTSSGQTGWFSYDVNGTVTEIWFKPPYHNRYTVTEVEISSTVPEPQGLFLLCVFFIFAFWAYRR